ncbi:MAG: hypothetical protein HWQ40_27985 [Nostoc sp. NMS9]|nr:hypothetical protein [Nostoc sp. NMS9]
MKYQIVLQHSEEDCGAACIATVAKHHGHTLTNWSLWSTTAIRTDSRIRTTTVAFAPLVL